MSGSWYDALSQSMSIEFTAQDFERHRAAAATDLGLVRRHLPPGARILDLGCGPGCMAVPLSAAGYRVVGLDDDPRVVAAARKNAERFGGDLAIVEGDVLRLAELFPPGSFDATVSGGLLEHFSSAEIRSIVAASLALAPVALAWMPVRTARTLRHYGLAPDGTGPFPDGIHRHLWSERRWREEILRGFAVVESAVAPVGDPDGGHDELVVVILASRSRAARDPC